MKILYWLAAFSICGLVGCEKKEPTSILSVCIFEPIEPGKVATRADLVALKAYADTSYNPEGRVNLIDMDEVEEIGYSFRFSSNQPLSASTQTIFDQGLPSNPKTVQDVVVGKVSPESDVLHELSIYVGPKDGKGNEENFVKVSIPNSSAGTVKLADGWIAAWFIELEKD